MLAAGDSAILNRGTLALDRVEIQGARSQQCAAIQSESRLTLLGASIITTNAAESVGGGVCVLGGQAFFNRTDLRFNRAAQGGGLYVAAGAAVESIDSYFTFNTTTGAGAYVAPGGKMTSHATGWVENHAAEDDPGGSGGAIYNAGEVALIGDVITKNSARDSGSLYNTGALTVERSDIDDNRAAAAGGGLYNTGMARLATSGLVNNQADQGGGFYNSATLAIVNATVSGNSGAGDGNEVAGGSATLDYSTLFNNGAVALVAGGGSIAVRGSIVDGCAGGGAITSLGRNLDTGAGCGFAQAGDLTNTDPLLGPLTQTSSTRTATASERPATTTSSRISSTSRGRWSWSMASSASRSRCARVARARPTWIPVLKR